MLVAGVLIAIIAFLMILFPEIFMKLKSPRIPEKLLKNPKMKMIIKIWGLLFVGVGIALIVISLK